MLIIEPQLALRADVLEDEQPLYPRASTTRRAENRERRRQHSGTVSSGLRGVGVLKLPDVSP